MNTRAFVTAVVLAAAASTLASAAGSAESSDLAKRTFQNAEQLMHEGKTDQALKAYQQIIQSFSESSLVDDALLRVGSFHYPTLKIAELGSVSAAEQEAARPSFELIRDRHPQSDSAPEAFYKLGLLGLEPDSARKNLDEAYASFYSVVNVYPESDWVPSALLGAGEAEFEKRNYDRAILSLERSLEGAPHGPVAAESNYLLGLANVRMGDFVRAAEVFQACRIEDEKSSTASRALNWITLVYKLRLIPAAGAAVDYTPDSGFVPRLPAGEDFRGEIGLAVSPAAEILVADPRRAGLFVFAEDGTKIRNEPMEGARRVAVDAMEKIVVASETEIRIGAEGFPAGRKAGTSVRRIEAPAGVWRSSAGQTFILDTKEGEFLVFGADPTDPKVVNRDKDAGTRLEMMAAGPEDRIFLFDTRQKQILVLENGKVRVFKAQATPPVIEDPVDMAVDALGDLYVADARQKSIFIIGPDGKKLGRIAPPAGTAAELTDPAALAVGPKGEVYVYDARKRTILRFR